MQRGIHRLSHCPPPGSVNLLGTLGAPLAHRNRGVFFAICDCDAHRKPQKSQRFPRQDKAMLHCDLRVRWKVASDLRFRAAISEPKTPSFCGISGNLAPSTRRSLAIAIVRFWCAKGAPKLSMANPSLPDNSWVNRPHLEQ